MLWYYIDEVRRKKTLRKIKLFFVLVASIFLLAACGSDEETNDDIDNEEEVTEEEVKDPDAQDKSDLVHNDDDLRDAIEEESGVLSAIVIVTEDNENMVLIDIEVDEDMEEAEAEELAEKYKEEVTDNYDDFESDIQVRKDGETFVTK